VAVAALAVVAAAAIVVPAAAQAASHRSKPVLAEGVGMREHPSSRVRALQRALVRHGYTIGPAGIDGRFGPRTRSAVRRAQHRHHLRVDGIVGPRTRRALSLGVTSRAASTHRGRSTTSQRSSAAPAEPSPTPAPVASRPAPAPAPARLSSHQSSSALLAVIPLVAVIAALFGLAYYRRRRRHAARIAAYHLGAVPRPSLGDTPGAAATGDVPAIPTSAAAAASSGGLARGAPVIGYVTEPITTGRELQRSPERNIERACKRAGWQLVDIARDRDDGRILERPSLSRALERIANGEARALVVNDARLLSRSADFATFVQWFRDGDAAFVALDLGLDTSTPEGTRVASALVTLNGWAGEWLNGRTRRSLADLRPKAAASRRLTVGERPEVLARIGELTESGLSAEQIADQFNDERVPTLFGTEKWWPSSVHAGLRYLRAGSKSKAEEGSATERS
jgi:DNA invertase Pin-like site-specific DNA recombinase/peptidoglycan hydrolase-like protein with peptidoglycan-binding domain